MTPTVLLLIRGHGFGHAARSFRYLEHLREQVTVEVASAGTGSDFLTMKGVKHHRFSYHDTDDMSRDATSEVIAYLEEVRPDFVVADEIFVFLHMERFVPTVEYQILL